MPVILFKTVKPARLKEDKMRLALLNAMRKAGTEVKKDLQRSTKTWEHQPKWEVEVSLKGPGPELLVGTDDEIYRYVDEGTGLWGPKHSTYEIWAGYYTGKSDKKVLAFPSAFTPKTTPGRLDAGPGFSGPVDTFRAHVTHPGIKPREFTKQVAGLWQAKFKTRMEQAMRDAARASGHSI
jgi:hypothetical protein